MAELGLILCIFAAALLYSSVGHGGGSGYLAMMALFGIAPDSMRPAALALNILVASIGAVRFYRAGAFSWPHFWPFAVASVPCAFLGGTIALPAVVYKQVVGLVLLFAAYRLFSKPMSDASRPVPIVLALLSGAGIGLLSGLTGVGGGIFLSPLLLLMAWTDTKRTCGVSAAFILVNSIAAIAGLMSQGARLPAELPYWTLAAVAGGLIGADLGSKRLTSPILRRLLAIVLVIAGLKMILTAETRLSPPVQASMADAGCNSAMFFSTVKSSIKTPYPGWAALSEGEIRESLAPPQSSPGRGGSFESRSLNFHRYPRQFNPKGPGEEQASDTTTPGTRSGRRQALGWWRRCAVLLPSLQACAR